MIVLTDLAVTQSSFQNYLGYPNFHRFVCGKVSNYRFLRYHERWVSFGKAFQNLGNSKKPQNLIIKSVATLEQKCPVQSKDGDDKGNKVLQSIVESVSNIGDYESSSGDLEDIDEREKLRRLRISKANKGNTPWNKGRKHSPETLQRIRERTKLAMQNPKVKMKLANMGHTQSEKTREKIAAGVRMGWQRRREKLMLQETCLFDWQNLIAEASRKGFHDEEELHWDSYKLLSEQLQREWLDSVEFRKTRPRAKGSKRAPKSLEQRRKIAEAIAAKWADPDYRSRVCSGLAKYHGIPEGAERKPRRKSSGEPRATRTPRKKVSEDERSAANGTEASPQQPKLKKRNAPKYKDPLASYKLEMIKSIRAQRVASESKKIEALQRAKLLIADAEKAAKALEVAAAKSPVAQASLVESRKLIAEAIQSIESINMEITSQDDASSGRQKAIQSTESIENMETTSQDNVASGPQIYVEKSEEPFKDGDQLHQNGMNGVVSVQTSNVPSPDFNLYELTILDKMDANYRVPSSLNGFDLPNLDLGSFIGKSDSTELVDQQHSKPNGAIRLNGTTSSPNGVQLQTQKEAPSAAKPATKKWVRGRLVEVTEVELNA